MTLTAATVGARSTRPGILVQLGDTHLSSRGTLSYAGQTWTGSGIALRGTAADGTGASTIQLSIDDTTNTWPARILAGVAVDLSCDLWLIYLNASGAIEAQHEFSGVVRQVSVTAGEAQQVQIEATSAAPDVGWTPRISWRSRYAVRRGAQVKIGTETYILE